MMPIMDGVSYPSLRHSFPPLMEQMRQPGTPGLRGCSIFFSLKFYMSLVTYRPKEHKCGMFQPSSKDHRENNTMLERARIWETQSPLCLHEYLLLSSSNTTKKKTPGNSKWDCYSLVYL